jgi:hypothetical protein
MEASCVKALATTGKAGSLKSMMNPHRHAVSLRDSLDAELEVLAALEAADDERLWRTFRNSPDEDHLLRVISDEAPRMLHRLRDGPYFSELYLVPVIENVAGTVIGNDVCWKGAEKCLSDAVRAWRGRTADQTVFRGVRPYEWIAAWEPSALRQHLQAANPGPHRALTFSPQPLVLPDGAPRLGFVVLAVGQRKAWPQLPVPDTLRDERFRQVVVHALADRCAAEVLPPDQVSAALADGLCLWLAKLHEAVGIRDWDLSPCPSKPDALRVCLTLGTRGALLEFDVRRHQLAPVGTDCISAMLASIAAKGAAAQAH